MHRKKRGYLGLLLALALTQIMAYMDTYKVFKA